MIVFIRCAVNRYVKQREISRNVDENFKIDIGDRELRIV